MKDEEGVDSDEVARGTMRACERRERVVYDFGTELEGVGWTKKGAKIRREL